ncbi:MAG: hypothetical protein IJX98_01940 [Clostridia bacterium]|nr:hypothetical protein [Clostridia bacterium]
MKKISAFEVAISALACALATGFLVLGTITPVLLFTAYMVACVALMLPLTKQSYWGYVLAYLGTVILSLIFCGFAFVFDLLPFIVFFGLHPLVNELQIKWKLKKWPAFFVKALWFDGAMYLVLHFIFEVTTAVEWLTPYLIPIVLVVGTAFFLFYDFTMFSLRTQVNKLVKRIYKK